MSHTIQGMQGVGASQQGVESSQSSVETDTLTSRIYQIAEKAFIAIWDLFCHLPFLHQYAFTKTQITWINKDLEKSSLLLEDRIQDLTKLLFLQEDRSIKRQDLIKKIIGFYDYSLSEKSQKCLMRTTEERYGELQTFSKRDATIPLTSYLEKTITVLHNDKDKRPGIVKRVIHDFAFEMKVKQFCSENFSKRNMLNMSYAEICNKCVVLCNLYNNKRAMLARGTQKRITKRISKAYSSLPNEILQKVQDPRYQKERFLVSPYALGNFIKINPTHECILQAFQELIHEYEVNAL